MNEKFIPNGANQNIDPKYVDMVKGLDESIFGKIREHKEWKYRFNLPISEYVPSIEEISQKMRTDDNSNN